MTSLRLSKFEHVAESPYYETIELVFGHNLKDHQAVSLSILPPKARHALAAYINQDRTEPVTYRIAGFSAESQGFRDHPVVTVVLQATAPSSVEALVTRGNEIYQQWVTDIRALLAEVDDAAL